MNNDLIISKLEYFRNGRNLSLSESEDLLVGSLDIIQQYTVRIANLRDELNAVENSEMNARMNLELFEKENAVLRRQLAEKEIELKVMRSNANQFKQWLARVTEERDAAMEDLKDEDSCRVCKYAIDEVACLCQECADNEEDTDCEKCPWCGDPCGECISRNRKWQWRGLKEDGGNDKL